MTDAKESEKLRELERIARGNGYWNHIKPFVEAITRERDEAVDRGLELQAQLMTMLVQRDEARRDVAAMREMLATAFREGWNCGGWKEDRDNVPSREYDWMHSAVKAKADAALTAALTQGDA
jgi:hypothetical protein